MKHAFLCVMAFFLIACNKQGENVAIEPFTDQGQIHLSSEAGQIFFKSDVDLLQQTRSLVKNFNDREIVASIAKVSFFKMENSHMALVYYYSNFGYSNIAIVKYDENQGGDPQDGHGYEMKCIGNCGGENCMGVPVLNENGGLEYIECSCADCKLHIIQH